MEGPYHHYIPRFLLRNFAIDKYERIFETNVKTNVKQQKKNGAKKNKKNNKKKVVHKQNKKKVVKFKPDELQTYDRKKNQLGISLVRNTYGYKNMYKDLKHEDVMHVEDKLSILEEKASKVIRDIIEVSTKNQVVLLRKELDDLRKFLFIMNYRNWERWSQFTYEKFDGTTLPMIKDFMQKYNLQRPQEVWLQNIHEILDTPYEEVIENLKIFEVDRDDFKQSMFGRFLMIWQAGENDEFIITNNGFGIFEGMTWILGSSPTKICLENISVNDGLPEGLSSRQFAYHAFYVISPKLVLVICHLAFRKEIGPDHIYEKIDGRRSMFEDVPHPGATPKYVKRADPTQHAEYKTPFDVNLHTRGFQRSCNDTFTFPFVKLTSADVRLVNSLFLNEARKDLVLTFLSRPYLYKTIVRYSKDKKIGREQDYSNLKKKLFMALNNTHEEDLSLRKNISTGNACIWNCRTSG